MQDDELTRLLAGLKARAPAPSAALMDRVLADALALQPAVPGVAVAQPAPRTVVAFWDRFAAAFGGLPTLAGLGSAAVVGLAVGYADPATIDYLTGGLSQSAETVDLFPTTDFLATEG